MLTMIFRSIFGTKHERDAKRMRPVVEVVNALEPAMQALSDIDLRGLTQLMHLRGLGSTHRPGVLQCLRQISLLAACLEQFKKRIAGEAAFVRFDFIRPITLRTAVRPQRK